VSSSSDVGEARFRGQTSPAGDAESRRIMPTESSGIHGSGRRHRVASPTAGTYWHFEQESARRSPDRAAQRAPGTVLRQGTAHESSRPRRRAGTSTPEKWCRASTTRRTRSTPGRPTDDTHQRHTMQSLSTVLGDCCAADAIRRKQPNALSIRRRDRASTVRPKSTTTMKKKRKES